MLRLAGILVDPRFLALGLVLGLAVTVTGTGQADDIMELDRVVVEFDAMGRGSEHHGDLYVRMSTDLGVPVVVLTERKAKWHLGWGELYLIHLLARESGQPFDIILADRRAGRGWGVIAHAHGVKLGRVVSAAHRSEKAWTEQRAKGGSLDNTPSGSAGNAKADSGPKWESHPGGGKSHGSGPKGKK